LAICRPHMVEKKSHSFFFIRHDKKKIKSIEMEFLFYFQPAVFSFLSTSWYDYIIYWMGGLKNKLYYSVKKILK